MQTAKIFMNGKSQAVRLPKEFRFSCDEVVIKKVGKMVTLCPRDWNWIDFIGTDPVSEDFGDAIFEARQQEFQRERESL